MVENFYDFISGAENKQPKGERDRMGNIIYKKGEGGERLLITASLEGPRFIVTRVEEDGKVRFSQLGNIKKEELCGLLVRFGDARAVISGEEDDLYLDFGMDSGALSSSISAGDIGELLQVCERVCGFVAANNMAKLVTSYILSALCEAEIQPKYETLFLFETQSELRHRGLAAAAGELAPKIAIALDLCPDKGVKPGEGAVLKLADRSLISDSALCAELESAAKAAGVSLKQGVFESADSPGGKIFSSGMGVRTAALSVPVRRFGSVLELVSESDIADAVALLKAFIC